VKKNDLKEQRVVALDSTACINISMYMYTMYYTAIIKMVLEAPFSNFQFLKN